MKGLEKLVLNYAALSLTYPILGTWYIVLGTVLHPSSFKKLPKYPLPANKSNFSLFGKAPVDLLVW